MRIFRSLFIAAFLCAVLLAPVPAGAQWAEDGLGVCTYYGNQYDPVIMHDGDGGAFIAWYDARDGLGDIYVQRLDRWGNGLWTTGGVKACIDPDHQAEPCITTDGAGGVIVAWEDNRNPTKDIYAQRLDGDGNRLWVDEGVSVIKALGDQFSPAIAPDGEGGAIIAWLDLRSGTKNDIYAQRVNAAGADQWSPDGEPVRVATSSAWGIRIAADGAKDAILAWEDYRNGIYVDIYADKIDGATGACNWGASNLAVCVVTGDQVMPEMAVGESFDVIITWHDYRISTADIYAQRVTSSGFALWTAGGKAVCAASGYQTYPAIAADGDGGAFIAWQDTRSSPFGDIYAVRIDILGDPMWTADGIPVCEAVLSQWNTRIVDDGDAGVCIAWIDERAGGYDLYAQRLSGTGYARWETNGVPVCTNPYSLSDIEITQDGTGGFLAVWEDHRNYYDIYAQRIERNGNWGYPAASITSVRDVPGDQGGLVNLAWDASRLDPWPAEDIVYYSIWRAIDEAAALAMSANRPVMMLEAPCDLDPSFPGTVIRREMVGATTYYWEKILDYYYAEHLESYSCAAPTLFDSTGVCSEHHYFQIISHGASGSEYWISAPDSGHSVDNLAPCPPLALAGEQSYVPEGLVLSWAPNGEADLDEYRVYRGIGPGFVPGPGSLLAAPCDTTTFDGDWSWDNGYCYKVAAVDVHGNESGYALLCSDEVTGDEPAPVPDATFLAQNWPNPFNPSTTIAFGLRERGHVSLRVYDAAGRLVVTLIDEARPAGQYTVEWDGRGAEGTPAASGVYFYKLGAGTSEQTKKMILLR